MILDHVLIAACAVLAIGLICVSVAAYKISQRLKKLTMGTNGKNLEDAIYRLMEDHSIFQNRVELIEQTNGRIDTEMKSAIRGAATVRFNAFSDVGGKQSFATALIDENGNGVIISSVYTRDRMNVYAKPLVGFSSEYELSGEEARALKEASRIFN